MISDERLAELIATAPKLSRRKWPWFGDTLDCLRELQSLRAALSPKAREVEELTDAQIVEIRDEYLPSQGEPFDCLAFARAILRATQSTTNQSTGEADSLRVSHSRVETDYREPAGSGPPCLPVPANTGVKSKGQHRDSYSPASPTQSAPAQEPSDFGPVDLTHEQMDKLAAPPQDEARELLEELLRRTADRAVHERIRAYLEKHK